MEAVLIDHNTCTIKLPWRLSDKETLAVQETRVQSWGGDDPLEEEMATHSSILDWRSPWTEQLGGLQSIMGSKRVGHDLATKQPQQTRSKRKVKRFYLSGKEKSIGKGEVH